MAGVAGGGRHMPALMEQVAVAFVKMSTGELHEQRKGTATAVTGAIKVAGCEQVQVLFTQVLAS
jgi:hypothetical protein